MNKIKLLHGDCLELMKDISDGCHTFGELYFHRMVLFSIIKKRRK